MKGRKALMSVAFLTKQTQGTEIHGGIVFWWFVLGWVLGFGFFFFFPSVRESTECLSFEKSWEGKLVSVIEMVSTFAKRSVSCASCLVTRKR